MGANKQELGRGILWDMDGQDGGGKVSTTKSAEIAMGKKD
jgi:hypothetical protein